MGGSRDIYPLPGADLIGVFDSVDPSQLCIVNIVSLANTKQSLAWLDYVIDPLGSLWQGRGCL